MVKQTLPYFAFIITILLILGPVSQDKLNNYLSNTIVNKTAPELINEGDAYFGSVSNYSKSSSKYEITFLEFSEIAFVTSQKMEGVIEEVKQKYHNKLNVVFLNILKPENKMLIKYISVFYFLSRIIINNSGFEYYMHTGFIALAEITKKLKNNE